MADHGAEPGCVGCAARAARADALEGAANAFTAVLKDYETLRHRVSDEGHSEDCVLRFGIKGPEDLVSCTCWVRHLLSLDPTTSELMARTDALAARIARLESRFR